MPLLLAYKQYVDIIKCYYFPMRLEYNTMCHNAHSTAPHKCFFMPNRLASLKPKERWFAGFILNKLWFDRYWCGGGKVQHLGHTALSNVPKGRPRSDHGDILDVADKLRKFGFISTFPSTGEEHVCASRAEEIRAEGLIVVNEYRVDVGLTPLQRNQI